MSVCPQRRVESDDGHHCQPVQDVRLGMLRLDVEPSEDHHEGQHHEGGSQSGHLKANSQRGQLPTILAQSLCALEDQSDTSIQTVNFVTKILQLHVHCTIM